MARPAFDPTLYLIVGAGDCRHHDLETVVREAVEGGVTMVQLREKALDDDDLTARARDLLRFLRPKGVPLIINDRPEVVAAAEADGLHVGQEDMASAEARRIIGEDRLLGVSAADPAELAAVELEPVDYLGVGPAFATGTKPDAGEAIGPEGIARVIAASDLPVVAIGGIDEGSVGELAGLDVAGIAVVSAIAGARDPRAAARSLKQAFKRSR